MTVLDSPPRTSVGRALQDALTDLVELHLQAKQLHWTVVGPGFRSAHEALDAVAGTVLGLTDEVAERMRALGALPNGRSADVAAGTRLPPAPAGEPAVADALAHALEALRRTTSTLEQARHHVEAVDPPSADLVNGAILALDQHAWLLRAELGPATGM